MTAIQPQAASTLDEQIQATDVIKNKSLIIFDWDGTLMDSIGLIIKTMHIAGAAEGFTTTDEAVIGIIGLSLEQGIEILFPEATEAQRAAIQQGYADYYIPNSGQTPLFAGIEPMLQKLQASGKLLAVATGKKRVGLNRVMDASDSHGYFVTTRCADESGSKPDPNMLNEILDETNTAVENAVFIGDSIHDIQMANAIGMTSIAVNYGCETAEKLRAQQPTYQVQTPEALIELLLS